MQDCKLSNPKHQISEFLVSGVREKTIKLKPPQKLAPAPTKPSNSDLPKDQVFDVE
jgi:hypothetical protein